MQIFSWQLLIFEHKNWGQFHESKVKSKIPLNFNRPFSVLLLVQFTFTLKFWGNYYSELELIIYSQEEKGGKVSIKVKSKIPPSVIPLNFWLMKLTPSLRYLCSGRKLSKNWLEPWKVHDPVAQMLLSYISLQVEWAWTRAWWPGPESQAHIE